MTLQLRSASAVTSAALAAALALTVAPGALAAPAPQAAGWEKDGLRLDAEENRAVDEFLDRAKEAEKHISPQVRTVAAWSGAELVGFDYRLKGGDSLKRKIATWLDADRTQTVQEALADINDSVRYTFQWSDEDYTEGATTAARTLMEFGNTSVRWSNTWKNRTSYKAINTAWADPMMNHKFEIQLHTAASRQATVDTHPLYEEQRLPSTSPKRAEELARQQGEIFAAVPVPEGARELTAPEPVRPGRVPQPAS